MKTIKVGDRITYIYSGGRTREGVVESIEIMNGEYNYADRVADAYDMDKKHEALLELEDGTSCRTLQVVFIHGRGLKEFKVSNPDGTMVRFASQAECDAYLKGVADGKKSTADLF